MGSWVGGEKDTAGSGWGVNTWLIYVSRPEGPVWSGENPPGLDKIGCRGWGGGWVGCTVIKSAGVHQKFKL